MSSALVPVSHWKEKSIPDDRNVVLFIFVTRFLLVNTFFLVHYSSFFLTGSHMLSLCFFDVMTDSGTEKNRPHKTTELEHG